MALLKIAEVAKRLGVHYRTVWGWIKVGKMQGVRVGEKLIRIPDSEVEKFKSRYEINEGKVNEESPQDLPQKKPEDPIQIV